MWFPKITYLTYKLTKWAQVTPPNLTLSQLTKHPLSHAHKGEVECISVNLIQWGLNKHILPTVYYWPHLFG